jgi:REP element-mobilizing transposase RayT
MAKSKQKSAKQEAKRARQHRFRFAQEPKKGRRGEKRGNVPHRRRAPLDPRNPALVTARLVKGLPNLRTKACYVVLAGALASGCNRFGLRLVEFSIQREHLHFIVEADDRASLSRGLQGLFVRIAKRLNKLWGRKGQVFAERYHDHVLTQPLEVRYALRYVLHNAKKHGHAVAGVDPYSSGIWFDGWMEGTPAHAVPPRFVMTARTWLLAVGWRKHGLIGVGEAPAA